MRDGDDWIRERHLSRIGGELRIHVLGRELRTEFLRGIGDVRYAIDRERCFDEHGARADDALFEQAAAALAMAVHDCYGSRIVTLAPSASVFEIHFLPGMSPFGTGRRVFVEGRLADLMRPHLGRDDVTFEYPVRVDGAAPAPIRVRANAIAELEAIA